MPAPIVVTESPGPGIIHVALNDPARRNALGQAMFDALDETLAAPGAGHVLVLSGRGPIFCAGFDLAAAAGDAAIMASFIERLGGTVRRLRRLPCVVIAAVQGAAIAGGCALVSAADLVVVSATAKLGYPVHRIGVSPAVTLPTLVQTVGPGAARTLVIGGHLIDGARATRLGLAARLSPDDASVLGDALDLAREVAGHGPGALAATKQWINELDGSLDDDRLDGPTRASAALARTPEACAALRIALDRRR